MILHLEWDSTPYVSKIDIKISNEFLVIPLNYSQISEQRETISCHIKFFYERFN